MRCAVLLSGGKDSVAAVEVAQGHAWDVVVAVVIRPEVEESLMFHTPNLDAAVRAAHAMRLPVIEAAADDDLAGLQEALQRAQEQYGAEAVLSGALASEYQRTRIDAIGHGLGLKTFAPLWHKHPERYMQSLLQAGYRIRFSRVAADGLPLEWAGQELGADELRRLLQLRMHPAGEGGEYETLVVDAPQYQAPLRPRGRVDATASRATWGIETFD